MLHVPCILPIWTLLFIIMGGYLLLTSYRGANLAWGRGTVLTPIVWLVPFAVVVATVISVNVRGREARVYLRYNSGDYLEFGERRYKGWPCASAHVNPETGQWEANPLRSAVNLALALAFVALSTSASLFVDWFVRVVGRRWRSLRRASQHK